MVDISTKHQTPKLNVGGVLHYIKSHTGMYRPKEHSFCAFSV